MEYRATEEAIEKLNEYKLTEIDVYREYKSRKEAIKRDTIEDIVMEWKGNELVILPEDKKVFIFCYGQAIEQETEEYPKIEYKNNKWQKK